MSRFGLRSQEYEDDDENDKTTKTTKNKHKRVYQKKKKKSSLSLLPKESSIEQHKNESDNIEEVEEAPPPTTTTTTMSLMCSLPLTRLSGFIEKLQLNNQAKKQATKYLLQQQQKEQAKNILFDSLKITTTTTTTTTASASRVKNEDEQEQLTVIAAAEEEAEEEQVDNEEDLKQQKQHSQHHNSNKYQKQKQQQQQNTQNLIIDKLMCLYCDKLFTTAKMQIKHIEKFHMLQQQQQQQHEKLKRGDRRTSVRNNPQQQKHANCNYCKKTTTTTTTNISIDELLNEINLNGLFMHLIECHADKYYGCKKCILRFPNQQKLQKHMQMLHATTTTHEPTTAGDDDDNDDTDSLATTITTNSSVLNSNNNNNNNNTTTTTKRSLRLLQQQTSLDNSNSTDTCLSAPLMSTEEPTILSRLGLAQNRLPTKRKSGMRLRRDTTTTTSTILTDKLRSGRGNAATVGGGALVPANGGRNSSQSTGSNTTSSSLATESPTREVLFRMPARNDSITSYVIDDDFYKEVINNVRHNLLYYLDGKLKDAQNMSQSNYSINLEEQQTLVVRSTLVRSPFVEDVEGNKELHAASLLNAITAFPTLLTAEQYGGDATKLRRAHTKHSWKWKWDSAKKYKLISEGGKIVKKIKPLMGLRDLSKLDMWTQLSMRQKFEEQQQQQQMDAFNELRLEKLRLNAQLNMILDKRLLPQISLEQNEQTIIKLEKEEYRECRNEQPEQHRALNAYLDSHFLSVLQLRSIHSTEQSTQPRLTLSGEWARPRSYMCMLCGAKFEKLKSLEEHKMFRHSHIYCTHYEVVGRELLANNLLQHLFLPKQALARYNAKLASSCENSVVTLVEDESSDSLQSSTTITTGLVQATAAQIVSPTHSLQSCSSSRQGLSPVTTPTTPTVLRTPCKIFHHNNNNNNNNTNDVATMRVCTKCQRKCSGAMDLYRHMLDCSGDYIWSMVKKRKYRYYCGSKKRRRGELRKTPKQQPPKTPDISAQKSPINNQPTPRQRPSDAESIKKMLENLPAKRVCKQIFPVDNKKRGRKSKAQQQHHLQRRKLMAKRNHHHLYKPQQQTRAVRRVRMATTSTTTTTITRKKPQQNVTNKINGKRVRRQSKRNLRLRNLQKRKQQQQQQIEKIKANTTKISTVVAKKSDTEERQSRSITPKQQEQQKEEEVLKKDTPTTAAVTLTTSTVTTPKTTTSANTVTTTAVPTTTMNDIFEYANSNASSTSTCTTNTLNSAASIPITVVGGSAPNTRKRSKRISDCIAMLTGKLEEKLKTEQQPMTTTTLTKVETPQEALAHKINEEQQQPKTPKRKAQTRRIFKPPSVENIVAMVEAPSAPITCKSMPIPITTQTTQTVVNTTPNKPATCLPPSSPIVPAKVILKNMPVISSTAIPTTTIISSPMLLLPPPTQLPQKQHMATTLTVAATATPLITTKTTPTNKIQHPMHLPLPLPLGVPMPLPMPLPTVMPLQMFPIVSNNFEEPLNLSNVSKNDNTSASLASNSNVLDTSTYRGNMYGLNMTQQIYPPEDIGPLDLSFKRKPTKEMTATSIANIMPLALTVIPTSNMNQPLALTVKNKQVAATQAAVATSAALFINECNKHFYSNLDLLKIPQVRSQLAALAATSTSLTPATSTATHVYTHNNVDSSMNSASGHMLPGATKATMVVAPIVKKRGKITTTTTTMTTTTTNSNLQTTRIIRLYPNKKEHQLTMNEEVINHIDDAINSVINAVKASLTPERVEDELEKIITIATTTLPAVIPITTTTTTATATIATVLPTTTTTYINNKPVPLLAPIMPIKRRGRSKTTDIIKIIPESVALVENILEPTTAILSTTINSITTTTTTTATARKNKTRLNLCLIEDICIPQETTTKAPAPLITTTTNIEKPQVEQQQQQQIEEVKLAQVVVVPPPTTAATNNDIKDTTTTSTTTEKSVDLPEEKEIISIIPLAKTTTTTIPSQPLDTSKTTIDKELANISEQPAPTQKKFRRRRKNELAAIVADQLLESFKIDKARRDSLKKLENLAYEHKSDDLFMTGMLLMSSTKRSVTLNNSQKQQQQLQTTEVDATTTKRASLRNRQNNNNNNNNDSLTTTAKRGRRAGSSGTGRRQYARRGKTLANENIHKLKSSLESFSIGIERQLTEFEAKKELQQQQKSSEVNTNNNNNNNIATKPITSSILRPSILSATMESTPAALTAENVAKVSEQSRSAFTCRDPRLNKNIHKETDDETLNKKSNTDVQNNYEEEDNYLTEIAKNVNEKIMAAENEDFIFANDGLLELEDTSSQFYSRPATSMSVRSAPNFDDRSDFGSLCGDDDEEEHTNTELMDMDLDDEMSVYTSYSQDLGRGSGRRRRRRRRSILLTRRPKKRLQRNEQDTEKFECGLCKKIFFSATSLSKHNMTLAHVSKVSEQEYLLSKAALLQQGVENVLSEFPSLPKPTSTNTRRAKTPTPSTRRAKTPTPATNRGRKAQVKALEDVCLNKPLAPVATPTTITAVEPKATTPLVSTQNTSHVGLNSDERLFFECCTILKGTQDDQENAAHKQEDSNHFSPYQYHLNNKIMAESKKNDINANKTNAHKKHSKSQSTFRDPPEYNKAEKNRMSPNYPGISQLSAVTNTSTFRIKTKAAMKGYENVDLTLQQDLLDNHKSRNSCKLSDLADIALGNQQKIDSASRSNRHASRRDSLLSVVDLPKLITESSTSSKTIMHSSKVNAAVEEHNKTNGSCGVSNKIVIPERPFKNIGLEEKEPINFQKPRTCSLSLLNSSTSELLTTGTLTTVVGTSAQEQSLSSASFSDRDDFDFGSLSCEEDEEKQQIKPDAEEDSSNRGVKTPSNSNQLVSDNIPMAISQLSNDSSCSHNSAKSFENKSLIMGRIFKNNTTKVPAAKAATKLKSVGVQKDPLPAKADLNQLFDELRGEVKPKAVTATTGTNTSPMVPVETDNELKNKIKTSAAPFLKIVPVDGKKAKSEVVEKGNMAPLKPKAKVGRKPKAKQVAEKPEKRGRKKSELKKSKNELGMSPQQSEQLVDEGQRKSKRRCATVKKFVETWSSDEYEEFLSTKDVIALIEEKEKQEQEKRKRKNSTTINVTAPTSPVPVEPNWQKEQILLPTPVVVAKKQRQQQEQDRERQDAACFMPIENEYDFVLPAHPPTPTIPEGMATNHRESKKESKKKKRKQQQMEQDMQVYLEPELNAYEMPAYVESEETPVTKKKRKNKHQAKANNEEDFIVQPANYLLHSMNSAFVSTTTIDNEEVTTHVEKKHKSHKKKKDKVHKEHKEHKEHKISKKKQALESLENCTPLKVKKKVKEVEATPVIITTTTKKHRGRKRKSEMKSNKKHSRRKREKYYWSSSSSSSSSLSSSHTSAVASSEEAEEQQETKPIYEQQSNIYLQQADEDDDVEEDDIEYDSSAQLQQQHGWIVGDSHKKLVTLLAIAKGSKKSEKKKKSSKKKNIK